MSNTCNSDNLNLKLDGLDLNDKHHVNYNPKPSLLSSSLANERMNRQQPSDLAPHFHSQAQYNDIQNQLNDHPEPELLATSVGRDMDGRLIPSSSTISLLSLNNQPQQLQQSPQIQQQASFHLSPQLNQNQFEDPNANYNYTSGSNRKTNIRSRNSLTHLNQKRFETYQRLTSPPPGQDHSTSQSIPINNKFITPDSPNLDPTSLNGSPSRFWLSSQTPPRSMNNSYKKVSALTQLTPHSTHPQPPHSHQSPHNVQANSVQSNLIQANEQLNSQPINIPKFQLKRDGDASPILNPVQTPSEEQPMTPLYLSNHEFQANYFSMKNGQIEEEEEVKDINMT